MNTNTCDGMYYEVTFNGDKNEYYLDAYKKWQMFAININRIRIYFKENKKL